MSCHAERWLYHVTTLLPQQDPDVLCLNEVGDEYLSLTLKQSWVREHYLVSDVDKDAYGGDRGNLVLVKKPLLKYNCFFKSNPGAPFRPAVIGVIGDSTNSLAIASVHFFAFDAYSATRKRELHMLTLGLDKLLDGALNRADLRLVLS